MIKQKEGVITHDVDLDRARWSARREPASRTHISHPLIRRLGYAMGDAVRANVLGSLTTLSAYSQQLFELIEGDR